jgi:hypothetical protein
MSSDSDYWFFYSMTFHDREFDIKVRFDGSVEWFDMPSWRDAGGRHNSEDFFSMIAGDAQAGIRHCNRMEEFTITIPPDPDMLPMFRKFASYLSDDDAEDVGDSMDSYFTAQFLRSVDPHVPPHA